MARSIIKSNAPYVYLERNGTNQFTLSTLIHLNGFEIGNVVTAALPMTLDIIVNPKAGHVQTVKQIVPITNTGGGTLTVNVKDHLGAIIERSIIEYADADVSTTMPLDYMIPYLFLKFESSLSAIVPYITIEANGYQYATDVVTATPPADPNCEVYVAGLASAGGPVFDSNPLSANNHSYPQTGNGYCEVTTVEYDTQQQINQEFPPISAASGSGRPPRKKRRAKIKNIYA
jgi:hypothetical protein